MKSKAELFVDQLLSTTDARKPSDNVAPDKISLGLPPWYDEVKFNRGRNFFWTNSFAFSSGAISGLVAVFSVPSILKILVATKRSSSVYTSYVRYLETLLHTLSWFETELKPGTKSWRSLHYVRKTHLKASLTQTAKGNGNINQRDLALTMFGFIGFPILKPDKFGIRSFKPEDWDDFNFTWRVISYMIGMEDKHNPCRETIDETIEVMQLLLDRVYTPALTNPPEYFEHMARVMLDGFWTIVPLLDTESVLFITKNLANVPGYVITEQDRRQLCRKLKYHLEGKPNDDVKATDLICKPDIEGLPDASSKILRLKDYYSVDQTPEYKKLKAYEKYKLNIALLFANFYSLSFCRFLLNMYFLISVNFMKYLPFMAFARFGVKKSYANLFGEPPSDDTVPKTNAEYLKPRPDESWFEAVKSFVW